MGNKLVVSPDKGVRRVLQNVVGAVLFGPPKLLGLPAGIWSQQVVTEDADNQLVAMKTNFVANRIRRKAQTLYFMLSIPLWLVSLWFVWERLTQFLPALAPNSVVSAATKQLGAVLWQYLLRMFIQQ